MKVVLLPPSAVHPTGHTPLDDLGMAQDESGGAAAGGGLPEQTHQ